MEVIVRVISDIREKKRKKKKRKKKKRQKKRMRMKDVDLKKNRLTYLNIF